MVSAGGTASGQGRRATELQADRDAQLIPPLFRRGRAGIGVKGAAPARLQRAGGGDPHAGEGGAGRLPRAVALLGDAVLRWQRQGRQGRIDGNTIAGGDATEQGAALITHHHHLAAIAGGQRRAPQSLQGGKGGDARQGFLAQRVQRAVMGQSGQMQGRLGGEDRQGGSGHGRLVGNISEAGTMGLFVAVDNPRFPAIVRPLISENVGRGARVRPRPRRLSARQKGPDYRDTNNRQIRVTPMSKRIAAKYKIDRRLGVNLWGRAKSPINKREYGPGQHGQRRKKPSDFGTQLRAKQKLKGYYGNISEKQFRKYFDEASRCKGDTSENLIGLLERRLDAVLYRMKLVPTVFASRQFINHGHVLVNGKRVNIASYIVKEGDEVSVRERSKQLAIVLEAVSLNERDVPDYIEVDHKELKGRFVRIPKLADVPYPVQMEPNLVVEFYSR